MVRSEDEIGANVRSLRDFVQGPVARDPRVFFEGTARFQEFSVKMPEKKGSVEALCEISYKFGVSVGVVAKSVVNVRNARPCETQSLSISHKIIRKTYGIQTS